MVENILLEKIKNIYRKISSAAIRSGRNPCDVKLIAVTKTVDTGRIKEAIGLGLRVFGENRVQETKEKISNLSHSVPDCKLEWHMIGHLQKNKVKAAVRLFDIIHSVNSARARGGFEHPCGKRRENTTGSNRGETLRGRDEIRRLKKGSHGFD